ncbi:MAG TPA: hypothetical protein VFC33_17350 [Acidimicrobiia bacterium]|nr:hypothetical protein [Acidimicrobiia bacterium]
MTDSAAPFAPLRHDSMIPGCGRRRSCVYQPTRFATVVMTRDGAELTRWELCRVAPIDLSLVDEVARLRLHALALGCDLRLRDVCDDLRELITLAGLADVLTDAER